MMLIHFSLSEGIKLIYPQPKVPKTDTERRLTKHTLYSRSTESVSARKESKQPIPSEEKKDVRNHQAKNKEEKHKDEDVKEKHPPIPDKRKHSKEKHVQVLVKEGIESPGKHSSPDRARRMSQIVETLNSERIQRIQSQNRRFSRMIGFDEVVSAAMQEVSDSGSVFSWGQTKCVCLGLPYPTKFSCWNLAFFSFDFLQKIGVTGISYATTQ